MTQQQLLILSFFDTEIGRIFTNNDLTSEMNEAGIGINEASKFPYYEIINFLIYNKSIVLYKDPSMASIGITKAKGPQLYILSDSASQILNRNKQKKEIQAYVPELEFNKLKTEYNLLSNQLSDYDETKRISKKSYCISIGSLIVAIISTLVAVAAIIFSIKSN